MRALAVVLFSLIVLACQSTDRGYLNSDIFEDVPAPRGATYLEDKSESFSYRSRTFRSARYHYEYDGTAAEVVRFYKETMTAPPYSWTFDREEGLREGSSRLFFSKDDDRCEVDVDQMPRPIARRDNVTIIVRVNHRK